MKRSLVVAGVLAGLTLASAAASAQTTFGVDAALNSHYFWRGITFDSKPVLQPDAYLTFPVSKASVTIGGWGNFELGKYNGVNDLSESGGQGALDLSEFDWWAEATMPAGKTSLTFGATGYTFPNDVGFTSAANTTEIYGKIGFTNIVNPKVAVWYDIDNVKGAYAEGSISYPWKLNDKWTFNLGALAGMSAGQEINTSKPTEGFNFAKSGYTHADLSVSTSFAAGAATIAPQVHFVLPHDLATKVAALNKLDESFKFWLGATVSWSKAMGGEKK
jgi:hypothetical protein